MVSQDNINLLYENKKEPYLNDYYIIFSLHKLLYF